MKDFLKKFEHNTISPVQPLSTEHQIASYIRASCDTTNGPIIYVDQVLRHGAVNAHKMPVVGSVFGSMERVYAATGQKSRIEAIRAVNKSAEFAASTSRERALRVNNFTPQLRKTNLTLDDLPICKYNEHDCGEFITSGVQVVQNFDLHQLGIHRMKKLSYNRLGCLAPPNRRVGEPFYEAEKNNKSIPMAVLIGAPPSVVIASQVKVPFSQSKYDCASVFDNQMEFMTINNFLIPATTEIVLMGHSVPDERVDDTPFSEYTGTMCFKSDAWVFEVDEIWTQKDPIFQALLTGRNPQEDSNLCRLAISAGIYKTASSIMEVTDVDIVGNGVFSALVCVKKNRMDEEVKNLIYTLLGNRYIKSVAVMDHDLSPTDEDFRFAFDSRYQPDLDTVITPHLLGASLDPSTPKFQTTSKIGFDLTFPMGNFKAHGRARVPGEQEIKEVIKKRNVPR